MRLSGRQTRIAAATVSCAAELMPLMCLLVLLFITVSSKSKYPAEPILILCRVLQKPRVKSMDWRKQAKREVAR